MARLRHPGNRNAGTRLSGPRRPSVSGTACGGGALEATALQAGPIRAEDQEAREEGGESEESEEVFHGVRDNAAASLANAIYRGKISGQDALPAWPIAWKNLDYTNSTNSLYEANTRHRAAALLDAIRGDPTLHYLPDPKSIAR